MALFTAIASAVTAVGAWVGSLGIIGSALLKTAVGIGLNLLAQSLAGKPKDPTFSINTTIQGGGDVPRSILLGKTATAGSLVWVNTWGQDGDSKNAYLTQVIALSDLPIKALTGVWVNSEKVDLTGSNTGWGYSVAQYRKDGRDNLWIKFYDGTQTAADTFLTGTCSNHQRQWSSNRVGRGVAYVVITALVAKNMFSGIPSFKFEVDGARLYDITKDSSAGGNGSQRWSDPSTWGGDGDHLPTVQAYNILREIRYSNKWLYGLQGVTGSRLPAASWIKQINKCRQQVQGAHGFEPMYRSGGELPVDAPIATALEAILTACQGRISEVGGTYAIHIGAPDVPVIEFGDGDILSTEEQTFTPFFGLADSVNGISATHPSPINGWVTITAPPLYRTDLEARHGNRRLMSDVPLDFVPYPEQVQRLMKSALLEAQRARRHTLVLPPRFWAFCTPGEYVVWSSVRNGYQAKMFRIDGVSDKGNLDVLVDITEVDPSDYAWDSSTEFRPPVDGAVGIIRPEPMPIISFGALPAVAQDSNGNNRRCGIRLFWDGAVNGVDYVQYEVRKTETLETIYIGRTEEVPRASLIIAPGMLLLPNQSYQVRARYGTYDGNTEFIWADWIRVITDDIRLGPLDIYAINIEQLNKDVSDVLAGLGETRRYVQEELDRIGAMAAEQEAGNYFAVQQLRREASVTSQRLTASYTELVAVSVGPGSAIATRIETLEAKVDEDVAKAVSLLTAEIKEVGETVEAQAQSITQLSVNVGNFSADGLIRITSEATSGSALNRIAFSSFVEAMGETAQAAMWLEAFTGADNKLLSRIVMNADQWIVTNGVNSAVPMTFIDGRLTLQVASIGEIESGMLRSPDGKFVINLAEGYLRISR